MRANGEDRVRDAIVPGNARIPGNVRSGIGVPETAAMLILFPRRVAPAGIGDHMAIFAEQGFDDGENVRMGDGLLGQR